MKFSSDSYYVKKSLYNAIIRLNIDSLLRYIFRHHTLIMMYHGVSKKEYPLPVWTQLPAHIFEHQIQWITKNYIPLTLFEFINSITNNKRLPKHSALITFDDGFKNNFSVAWPILQKYNVPATIFLTVNYIGTDILFWVDELLVCFFEAINKGYNLPFQTNIGRDYYKQKKFWESYCAEVNHFKRLDNKSRRTKLELYLQEIPITKNAYREDFGLLSWEEVRAMRQSPLIDFGVHTATHQILTSLSDAQIVGELFTARKDLEKKLGRETCAFCYPNGHFGLDYTQKHVSLLQQGDYRCAFSADPGLFSAQSNPFHIPRVPAANDSMAGFMAAFMSEASGLCELRRCWAGKTFRAA